MGIEEKNGVWVPTPRTRRKEKCGRGCPSLPWREAIRSSVEFPITYLHDKMSYGLSFPVDELIHISGPTNLDPTLRQEGRHGLGGGLVGIRATLMITTCNMSAEFHESRSLQTFDALLKQAGLCFALAFSENKRFNQHRESTDDPQEADVHGDNLEGRTRTEEGPSGNHSPLSICAKVRFTPRSSPQPAPLAACPWACAPRLRCLRSSPKPTPLNAAFTAAGACAAPPHPRQRHRPTAV
ncbi:hypothetical protein BHE74_00012635 [Ensete ventricosum]|nr:hypothetical protein BHE74_00012635 [Ensete ventricosum]